MGYFFYEHFFGVLGPYFKLEHHSSGEGNDGLPRKKRCQLDGYTPNSTVSYEL